MIGRAVSSLIVVCRLGTLASFLVLIASIVLQVSGRLSSFTAPAWTEEIARFSMLYLVAFSCGIAQLRGELVNVDLFVNLLPPSWRRVADRIATLIVIVFAAVIIKPAWIYLETSFGEVARSIEIPMPMIYVVALIVPVALIVFSVARLLGYGRSPEKPRC